MSKWTRLMIVTGMFYGAIVAVAPTARANEEAKCCSYGVDCPGDQLCCNPGAIGALACSAGSQGYCRDTCS